MTRRTRLWLLLFALVLVAAAAGFAAFQYSLSQRRFDAASLEVYYSRISVPSAQVVGQDEVNGGIAAAADYLRRFSEPSGQFVYLVNMNPSVTVPPAYSLLRHAGTIYSLGMANSVLPDESTVQVMKRATDFMRGCCLSRLDEASAFGIWEPPEIMHSASPPTYKLGGAGLGLMAMASIESIRPGTVPADEMLGLAALGRFLQRSNGDFHGSYVPSDGGKKPLQVLFYPGEMALGWLSLYELQPKPELIQWSIKALEFLARERAVLGAAPPDHWALLATAKLFELANRDGFAIPREALIVHALQICHQILDAGYSPPGLPAFDGAMSSTGGVTPTATRLEGLLAALTFIPAENPIRPHLEPAAHRGISFLLRAQVKDGEFAGGFPSAPMPLPDDGTPHARRFNRQATEIRIDYVQHSLSALVQYLRWTSGQGAIARTQG